MIAKKFWVVLPLGILLCIQTWLLNSHYPYIASDMYYYLTRLIDTYIHININGVFSVQWWTPTFGGGIPAFPNPLHLQFSITPYLMFFFSPWVSCQITYILMASLGYFLIYNYITKHTDWGFFSAVCTASIFTTNGYFINHILIGHLNYSSFTIIAIVPFLISSSWSIKKCVIVVTTSITYLIYSAGFPTIFLFYISLGQLFFFLPIIKKEFFPFKRVIIILFLSHIIIFGLVSSKITAVTLQMEVFPRILEFFSWQPYYQVLLTSIFAQLFSWRILMPFETILPIPADSILFWLIGSKYEFWENDVSLSPVVPFVIFFYMIAKFPSIKNLLKSPTNRYGIVATLIIIWVSIEMSMGKGFFWTLIKDLPVIKSSHVNVRYAGALTLFASIIFAHSYSYLIANRSAKFKMIITLLFIFITFLSMACYKSITTQKEAYHNFDLTEAESAWSDISNKSNIQKVTKIVDVSPHEQSQLFKLNASSLKPSDALFGYHGQYFRSSLKSGNIDEIDKEGFYNFHNPLTFYDPKIASIPRAKIHSHDYVNFNLFINRKQPNWELPLIQKVANYITLASLFLFFLYIAYFFLKRFQSTHT